jgi:hypothetical protein
VGVVERARAKDSRTWRVFRGDLMKSAWTELREDRHDRVSLMNNSIGILYRVVGIPLREGYRRGSRNDPG